MRVGGWTVSTVETGTVRLDGGAMFGSVPRVLWEREHVPDESHRILLAERCMLLRGHDRCILVDTGMGEKWSPKEIAMFDIATLPGGAAGALERAGVGRDEVTDVILTHLHFDHAGGVTEHDENGVARLVFPRARHWVQRRNWENARAPGPRERASYLPENVDPLAEGDLVLLDGIAEIAPGVTVRPSHGHTEGLQMVLVTDEAGGAVYVADMIPTASHVRLPYTMGYDIAPGLLVREKEALLAECVERNLVLVFEHDPVIPAAGVLFDEAKGTYRAGEPVEV